MKRPRSKDDLRCYHNKDKERSSSRRPFSSPKSSDPPPPLRGKSILTSYSSRFDRDRPYLCDGSRGRYPSSLSRQRDDHDFEHFDRRKGSGPPPGRYSDGKGHPLGSVKRVEYPNRRGVAQRDCFSVPQKDFPKRVRSDRDRSRSEGYSSSSSWHRIGNVVKDINEARSGRCGFGLERELKALKYVRSPTWSRDSGSDQSKSVFLDVSWNVRGKDKGKSRSLSRGDSCSEQQSKMSSTIFNRRDGKVEEKEQEQAEEKSPSWSSRRSRSFDANKCVDGRDENRIGSEMEEGELEPDASGIPALDNDVAAETGAKHGVMEIADQTELLTESDGRMVVGDVAAAESTGKEVHMTSIVEGRKDRENEDIAHQSKNFVDGTKGTLRDKSKAEFDIVTAKNGNPLKGEVESSHIHFGPMKGSDIDVLCHGLSPNEEAAGVDFSMDVKFPKEGLEARELHTGNLENAGFLELQSGLSGKPMPIPIERGKNVALVPDNVADAGDDSISVGVVTNGNIDGEGPSTRGLELFPSSPVSTEKRNSDVIKLRDDNTEMEPLDLSLSLPNVLLPIGAREAAVAAPASSSQGRSMQPWSGFRTNSEGFMTSISCSGSQSLFHNPSCSLTQISLDFEQSVKSRPLFQGVDWQALAQSESKHDDPAFYATVSNGNSYLPQSQALKGTSDSKLNHGLDLKVLKASPGAPNGLDRQLSLHRQVSGGRAKPHDGGTSPSQSDGCHKKGAEQGFDWKRGDGSNCSGSLYQSGSWKACEPMLSGSEFVESVIEKMLSEPPCEMAGKFHEMQGEALAGLKESVHTMMVSTDKHRRLLVFQEALQDRTDITMEMLLKSHRCQLEIMVALKTGQTSFLHQQTDMSTFDLAEIFLNLRCRNLACRSPLPVNECDCKVCMRKNGFCSECMCLLCFKFDMASNTCTWVGCDLCLHWCHVDCAIREFYIRNGPSASERLGAGEVQFYCVACDHPSEMFGFVKDVFQSFSKEWSAENFCRELEYVRRIFSCSKDMRGRWLCGVADQMLARLADKANLPEVCNDVITLLKETDPSKFVKDWDALADCGKEAGPSKDISRASPIKNPQGGRGAIDIGSANAVRNEGIILDSETRRNDHEEPRFFELESIVRIKQAEAKMYQARADDSRREAESLRCIAVAKNKRTEEEFKARIAKLSLAEAEEAHRRKFEELKALERSHREYFNMKIRMEAEIEDLLLKMEATKPNTAL